MKLLHTSDWHLGHMLYDYDRREEQTDMLRQIAEIVKEEKPDLFLLAGDVFHVSQPSAMIQKMFVDAMTELHEANPDMTIVVTAGNHDSASRHEVFRNPWRLFNIHSIGTLDKDDYSSHIIEIEGKGFVVALPYAHERNIPEGFIQGVLDEVTERNTHNLPVIMTAHTTLKGCDYRGHENSNENTIGGIEGTSVEDMGTGYDYLALGHIHRRQRVSFLNHVRYSGSPLPTSFDDDSFHYVNIVEINSRNDNPTVRKIEISNIKPFVNLPIEGYVSWEEACKLLEEYPAEKEAYIRLNVETDGYLPSDAHMIALNLTKDKKCRFCIINVKRTVEKGDSDKSLSVVEFKTMEPIEMARIYAGISGNIFDEEMEQLFNEALDLLTEEERQD